MESFGLLLNGFSVAFQPHNLLFALIGCILGNLVGVLPGLGSTATIAILLPITFELNSTASIIMLAAIWYGSAFGGTITSVLTNTPGEACTAITCLEGYPMAKQGRAGSALTIAALGSFVGGTMATFGLVLVALPLSRMALRFGSPEFFALMVLGLAMVTGLAGRSMLRGLIAAILGLYIGMVGLDPVTGGARFTLGMRGLMEGFTLTPVVMGLFGISEILINVEQSVGRQVFQNIKTMWLTKKELKDSLGSIVRGTIIGCFMGVIPGLGAAVSTFMSYIAEKKFASVPEHKWGTGVIQGVAGPETANNANTQAHMIPLFTLGLPTTSTAAVFMGALMINGLTPGPLLFQQHGEFIWAIIASMYVGNIILVVLNVPLIPMWTAILRIPYASLFALILLFCVLGGYSMGHSVFDVGVMTVFGVVGYLLRKLDIPIAPVVLTLILGPMVESSLRESLQMSQGDFGIFFSRPISLTLLVIAIAVVIGTSVKQILISRDKGAMLWNLQEDD